MMGVTQKKPRKNYSLILSFRFAMNISLSRGFNWVYWKKLCCSGQLSQYSIYAIDEWLAKTKTGILALVILLFLSTFLSSFFVFFVFMLLDQFNTRQTKGLYRYLWGIYASNHKIKFILFTDLSNYCS